METIIRTSEPRELLALIPYQLGFQPGDSAVVVSIRADHSRVGLVARVDLADLAGPDGSRLARALASHLVDDGARRAVTVVYTAEDLQVTDEEPPAGTVAALRAVAHLQEAAEYFLGPLDCWVVGSTGYYALGCTDHRCCPPGGRPLSDLQGTQVGAEMVLEGVGVAGSRDQVARIDPAPPAARKSARRARDRWGLRGRDAVGCTEEHRWRREGLQLWRTELDRACAELAAVGTDPRPGTPVDPYLDRSAAPARWRPPRATVAGRLQAALADVLVRDAVLLSFVAGTERVGDRVVAGDGGEDVGKTLRAILDPTGGRKPDPDRTSGARAVLEHVVAHAPLIGHAPALTLLAVLAWWSGDGARATILVERALTADPGHRLALLLDEALCVGMPPGWLRHR